MKRGATGSDCFSLALAMGVQLNGETNTLYAKAEGSVPMLRLSETSFIEYLLTALTTSGNDWWSSLHSLFGTHRTTRRFGMGVKGSQTH